MWWVWVEQKYRRGRVNLKMCEVMLVTARLVTCHGRKNKGKAGSLSLKAEFTIH